METLSMHRERGIFEELRRKYPNAIISPGTIRLETLVENGKNLYPFEISKDTKGANITEERLGKNDIFAAYSIGLFLFAVKDNEFGLSVDQTYPNEIVFPAVATAGSEFDPKHLELFYKSSLRLEVDNIVHIEKLKTKHFRKVPETQQSAAGNKSQSGNKDGYLPLISWLTLNGDKNINLTLITPPSNIAKVANTNAGMRNFIAIEFEGFLVNRGAKMG